MFFHPTPAFKAYLTAQRAVQEEYRTEEESKTMHGDPCSCQKCKSVNLTENTTSSQDYLVMEYEVVCRDCLSRVAYWAHGHYEPNYPPEHSPSYF